MIDEVYLTPSITNGLTELEKTLRAEERVAIDSNIRWEVQRYSVRGGKVFMDPRGKWVRLIDVLNAI